MAPLWINAFAVVAVLTLVESSQRSEYITNKDLSQMLLLSFEATNKESVKCTTFETGPEIVAEINRVPSMNLHVLSDSMLAEFVQLCDKANWYLGNIPTEMIIFPGTKWCGLGNTAEDYDDLGENKEADICCREHDSCPLSLQSNKSLDGITNHLIATVSRCDCDQRFYMCLANNDDDASDAVGKLHFNIFKIPCFKMAHPITGCLEFISGQPPVCQKYTLDTDKPKKLQMFTPVYFKGKEGNEYLYNSPRYSAGTLMKRLVNMIEKSK